MTFYWVNSFLDVSLIHWLVLFYCRMDTWKYWEFAFRRVSWVRCREILLDLEEAQIYLKVPSSKDDNRVLEAKVYTCLCYQLFTCNFSNGSLIPHKVASLVHWRVRSLVLGRILVHHSFDHHIDHLRILYSSFGKYLGLNRSSCLSCLNIFNL